MEDIDEHINLFNINELNKNKKAILYSALGC